MDYGDSRDAGYPDSRYGDYNPPFPLLNGAYGHHGTKLITKKIARIPAEASHIYVVSKGNLVVATTEREVVAQDMIKRGLATSFTRVEHYASYLEYTRKRDANLKESGLAKLTDEEKRALGLA